VHGQQQPLGRLAPNPIPNPNPCLCYFAPWLIRPLACSPPGSFTPSLIHTHALDNLPPGSFAYWLVPSHN